MSKSNKKYKCAVDGVVVVFGYPRYPKGMSGVCVKSSVSTQDGTFCMAHGNKKCKHKIKPEQNNNK